MNTSFSALRRREGVGITAVLMMSLALVGCVEKEPTGTVQGSVTFQGKPLTTGTVHFFAEDKGTGLSANLDSTGSFKIEQPVPGGKYKVYFTPPEPEPQPPGSKIKPVRFTMPTSYQDPTQSPVEREIKEGENKFDFKLPE